MTLDQIKKWLTVFDLPSGVVLGLYTVVMIALSAISVVWHKEIPGTVITLYGMVLGGFCVHKTTTAINGATEDKAGGKS